MALHHPLILQVAMFIASNPLFAATGNGAPPNVGALVATDTSSFYGGGSVNESLPAVDLALQHINSCPDIPRNTSLVHIFTRVSSVMIGLLAAVNLCDAV
jgi:hypothetical protein